MKKWFWDVDGQCFRSLSTKEVGQPQPGDYIRTRGDYIPFRPEEYQQQQTGTVKSQQQ